MSQEAITEIDMDVFSRRIGPYFTWLESRIESGWQQSDSVQKDVLKEVKYLATTMRARFILGVSRDDFTKEVQRTVELFELAGEAFPSESDEVESKLKHFAKGVQEELGAQFLPAEYRTETPRPIKPLDPHPFPTPEPMPGPEPDEPDEPGEPDEPDEEKISQKIQPAKPKVAAKKPVVEAPKVEIKKVEAPKVEIKKTDIKVAKPKAKKVEISKVKAEPSKAKAKPAKAPKKKKAFFFKRWVKEFIWGPE